jgi:ribosomal protein RSM22 (predicted rRNA methylase)
MQAYACRRAAAARRAAVAVTAAAAAAAGGAGARVGAAPRPSPFATTAAGGAAAPQPSEAGATAAAASSTRKPPPPSAAVPPLPRQGKGAAGAAAAAAAAAAAGGRPAVPPGAAAGAFRSPASGAPSPEDAGLDMSSVAGGGGAALVDPDAEPWAPDGDGGAAVDDDADVVDGSDSDSDGDGDGDGDAGFFGLGASANPYIPAVRTEYRSAPMPPPRVLRALESVLSGRNVSALNAHWTDMARALKERNVSLLHDAARADRLRQGLASGAITGVPADAVTTDSPPLLYGPTETLAYALHGFLPSYGVALRVFRELEAATPRDPPTSMLDFGCGPGSAVLAAREVWPDSLFDVVVVEPSRSMTQVAEHMLADTPGVMYRRTLDDVARYHRGKRFDLVVAHGVLGQLTTDAARDRAVADLWDLVAPRGSLVLTEPGDRWGGFVVRRSRDLLLHRATAIARFLPQLQADYAPPADELPDGGTPAALEAGGGGEFSAGEGAGGSAGAAGDGAGAGSPVPRAAADAAAGGSNLALVSPDDFTDPPALAPGAAAPPARSPSPLASAVAAARGGPPSAVAPRRGDRLPSPAAVKKLLREYAAAAGLLDRMLRPPADALGAAIVGPCPHARACPVPGNSWCHFAQAVARHRKAGRSVHTRGLPRRWANFSYVTVRKVDAEAAEDHPPHQRAGWSGEGAFSVDIASLEEHRARQAEAAEAAAAGDRDRHRAAARAAAAAASGAVLRMARQNLEPDTWWLERRPGALGRGDGGDRDRRGGGDGARRPPGAGPTVADAVRATAESFPEGGTEAFARSPRRGPFGSPRDDSGGAGAGAAGAGGGGPRAGEAGGDPREAALEDAVRGAVTAGLPGAGQWARLARPPLKRDGHVVLDVCTPQGTFERRVASRGKLKAVPGAYRAARKARWGGRWPNWLVRLKGSEPPSFAPPPVALEAGPKRRALPAGGAPGGGAGEGAGGSAGAAGSAAVTSSAAGAPAPRTRPPRDRSGQVRASRRARQRKAYALAMDDFATEADRAKAQFAAAHPGGIAADAKPPPRVDAASLLSRDPAVQARARTPRNVRGGGGAADGGGGGGGGGGGDE